MKVSTWRPFLLFVRDRHRTARACSGLDRYVDDPAEADFARRLAYPVVRPREIWTYGQRYDVDPFLVMAIMRQESTYRNAALSPVRAIGLIQVMPAPAPRSPHCSASSDTHHGTSRIRRSTSGTACTTSAGCSTVSTAPSRWPSARTTAGHTTSRWYQPDETTCPWTSSSSIQ